MLRKAKIRYIQILNSKTINYIPTPWQALLLHQNNFDKPYFKLIEVD